ncbi:MerR family transcriptional regulator [Amycolatopsis thailandensis]|uniref:MerR family transcriptional regulator n=1 Tax=Amycolatopsis thailandensis TaxID=589330 RepID=A0A229S424_9PSEU|nr:MerR family transcriptional regulator [Amycolatopsis thailandensis]OXM53344.1 MerR family transcriptional regulator [Amycolatopsis thailandensis]
MFSIGDFAKHGRVSVRMLRHYDAIGLLRPAHVDPFSGYRSYTGDQLARLNRVIALKDLGFTLTQVQEILDAEIGADELRGMLRLRRAELEAAIAADEARLTAVEARLRSIESEGRMPSEDVVVKSLPAVRVAELTGTASGYVNEEIGPVVQGLYKELFGALGPITPSGPLIAYYEDDADGERVLIHAAVPIAAETDGSEGFSTVSLAEVATAATILHRGSMETVLSSYQALAKWVDAHGYRANGPAREFYLDCPADGDKWVTELQQPITMA